MVALTDVQIGSIVAGMIINLPVGISGILTTIVDQQIYFAAQVTGNTIPVGAVIDEYQPAIINLSAANILELMQGQGQINNSISLGELSVNKGLSNISAAALREDALMKLNAIGQRMSFYQCWG